ncbi:hypothetical protein JQC92_09695 [Shewanella sp. 202IG2-18]|uniref:DUF7010 family protein n=1 Tax=Parashewanella hymeniacidonis TaxID=2807618 RepID=UPI001961AB2D|nr:hypothetical protein [Parashewanella hymeniacidonis]MBM7072300.1 hypothetical protein [Parashewanella hymeniacidonis]
MGTTKQISTELSLEQHRHNFKQKRFLAMPLSGTIAWLIIAVGSYFFPESKPFLLWICTGSIIYFALFLSKFTGEDILGRKGHKNPFDQLFLLVLVLCMMIFAIAIPFAQIDHRSIPLTVGILTGLMWIPFSWSIQHWVGLLHGIARTLLILAAWYIAPEHSFTLIPTIIVFTYIVTIPVLELRWRKYNSDNQPIDAVAASH